MNNASSFVFKIVIYLFCIAKLNAQKIQSEVITIFPSTDSIPVNILRFYIQFSLPMQEMDILKHIHLYDDRNINITGVFYENQYELWNSNRTQVTLIVDPGRVKLGLLANNILGRAFDVGKKYTLKVDSLLMDFNNETLKSSFIKTFIAIPEDVIPPDVTKWKLSTPNKNTKKFLEIDFQDKIDHVSAHTLIKVFQNNQEVRGNIHLSNEGQKWYFTPSKKWKGGSYQLVINPRLEDISANSINQLFDHKPSNIPQNNNTNFILDFTIK